MESTATTPASSTTKTTNRKEQSTTTKKKSRPKKKSTTKHKSKGADSSSAQTSAAALTKKAKVLYERLQQQKDAAFHDAAWLSNIPSQKHHPLNTYSPSFLEQDLEIVQRALKANGLSTSDVTAQAYGCLLESARKFALELIDDAAEYSMLSSADEITPADLKFAAEENQKDNLVNSAENLDLLTHIADETNRSALPPIPNECYNGIVLPPPEHNLLGRTFDIVSHSIIIEKQANDYISHGTKNQGGNDQIAGKNDDEAIKINVKKNKRKTTPSYGASRGPQIEIKLNTT